MIATDSPLVSVVISTYNRHSSLETALESVGAQTYDRLELVVVDDHSQPPARDVVDAADVSAFEQVTYVRHDENRGANAARNTGIDAASGEFLAFLDDDDRWVPEKIARQLDAFEDGVGVVYTGMEMLLDGRTESVTPPEVRGDITKALLCRNVVGTLSAVMVRADIADTVRFDERFPSWADLEWYIHLSTQTAFRRVPEPLVRYDLRSQNRLSDDFEKKRVSYDLFIDEFSDLAARYGRLFRRKFVGWAAFRVGSSALYNNRYSEARQLLATAVLAYPLEPRFLAYFLASAGGRVTHRLGRKTANLGD
jgi:glycosyltransferase involved in cell wall biosynthesis